MGKPISKDLREWIVTAYQNVEGSQAELVERFVVSQSNINRLLKPPGETGSTGFMWSIIVLHIQKYMPYKTQSNWIESKDLMGTEK